LIVSVPPAFCCRVSELDVGARLNGALAATAFRSTARAKVSTEAAIGSR